MLFILLLIPNQFGTVIELGVQGLETLEQLEIQYRKAEATQCLARSTHVHSHRSSSASFPLLFAL